MNDENCDHYNDFAFALRHGEGDLDAFMKCFNIWPQKIRGFNVHIHFQFIFSIFKSIFNIDLKGIRVGEHDLKKDQVRSVASHLSGRFASWKINLCPILSFSFFSLVLFRV